MPTGRSLDEVCADKITSRIANAAMSVRDNYAIISF